MPLDYDKYSSSGTYMKFNEIGDQIVGVIKEAREGKDYNGDPCPELVLEDEDGNERIVSAGQALLKAALAEKRPNELDKIRITYSGNSEGKPGRNPAKQFTVDVKEGPHEVKAAVGDDAPF